MFFSVSSCLIKFKYVGLLLTIYRKDLADSAICDCCLYLRAVTQIDHAFPASAKLTAAFSWALLSKIFQTS